MHLNNHTTARKISNTSIFQTPSDFTLSIIHFYTPFFSGEGRGAAAKGGLEIPQGSAGSTP